MNLSTYGFILVSVFLSAAAQITLKIGMNHHNAQHHDNSSWVLNILAVATNSHVILGLLMYGLGAMLWLAVLSKFDVSKAYPFVGLGFVVTMILGHIVLQEAITPIRLAGTFLVVAGVILVSQT
ncbi:EamA family transporter [Parasalinivibrio latis]|uniref:EamA family transporter n=1 Tax=Parasalinivibrio latis TaxID=2952610 RepID=UPI0030E48583